MGYIIPGDDLKPPFPLIKMKKFKLYYSDERIISYLIKIRVSYAQKRNKKHLLNNLSTKENHRHLEDQLDDYDIEIIETLDKIMPKRRLWVTLDKASIYEEGKKLNSIEKNRKCLLYTIKKYRKRNPQLPFVIELNKFIKDIQDTIENKLLAIESPDILPEVKSPNKRKARIEVIEKGFNECRPISRFKLKDRIILSITNKFLTKLFDEYFEDSSFAFRSVNFLTGEPVIKNHHAAIHEIIEYKKKHSEINLVVAECDIKKFYDSVNHEVCIKSFYSLIQKAKFKQPNLDLELPISIFLAYLKSYSFQENVLVLNDKESYWNKKGVKGNFPWIDKEINNLGIPQKANERIGVPQGGALSGLIANIILDSADKEMKKVDGLLYIRYCDDMLLMHPQFNVCESAVNNYVKVVNEKQLFTHPFENKFISPNNNHNPIINTFETRNNNILQRTFENTISDFWRGKSKGPYNWGPINIMASVFPWIGFVGYEIKFTGETRVRVRSINKEIEKQKRVVQNILKAITHKKVVLNDTILRSAYEKLNGMSVGRFAMYNYKYYNPEMCWAVGFQKINFNSYSSRQLKLLDRNKYKQVNRLKRKIEQNIHNPKKRGEKNDNNEILKYHNVFSYHYQVGKKKKES